MCQYFTGLFFYAMLVGEDIHASALSVPSESGQS